MSVWDWLVLGATMTFIVVYGVWKTKSTRSLEGYFRSDSNQSWWSIGLSVMATQASAITFLSTPGQAYEDGMRFIQFYFGLPLAIIFISVFILPVYYKLKLYTAYEYLEHRFDLRTRLFVAFLFLLQRGLQAGITIYAPAIVLSTLLGWDLQATIVAIGAVVVFYTVVGGTKAVSQTQMLQMAVMIGGMFTAAIIIVNLLPDEVGIGDAFEIAGAYGKLNAVTWDFNLKDKYNIWSGLLGGFFLALSYFGTDQSQVARYLGGRSLTASRLGLLFNALFKIPMQFLILFVGVLVFVFYIFNTPPVYFNQASLGLVSSESTKSELRQVGDRYSDLHEERKQNTYRLLTAESPTDRTEIVKGLAETDSMMRLERDNAKRIVSENLGEDEAKDSDYIFLGFISKYFPTGLLGLIIAVILCAAMSSTASELNALASTSMIDFYKRLLKPADSERRLLVISKGVTLAWGIVAILFALYATLLDNLIQAINTVGSVFYGTILGVFIAGIYVKRVGGLQVFAAAVVTQILIGYLYYSVDVAFLWFNVIGCVVVVSLSLVLSYFKWAK